LLLDKRDVADGLHHDRGVRPGDLFVFTGAHLQPLGDDGHKAPRRAIRRQWTTPGYHVGQLGSPEET
jgi:hypothetical protein